MALPPRYTGLSPQRVSKDAKYTVSVAGEIRLEFQQTRRVRIMLTTEDHPRLAEMVNAVKRELAGRDGGAFYINEFSDVLVPDGEGGPVYYAGNYDDSTLVFRDGDLVVSPVAPPGLQPGELWPGPHVGIPYVLNAGATDIKYEKKDGRKRITTFLSDDVGEVAAMKLAKRLAVHKGNSGGRIFINERAEFFAPVGMAGDYSYVYLGHLGEDQWFYPPDEYDRP